MYMYMYTHSSPQDLADAQDLRKYKRKLGIKDYNKDFFTVSPNRLIASS